MLALNPVGILSYELDTWVSVTSKSYRHTECSTLEDLIDSDEKLSSCYWWLLGVYYDLEFDQIILDEEDKKVMRRSAKNVLGRLARGMRKHPSSLTTIKRSTGRYHIIIEGE